MLEILSITGVIFVLIGLGFGSVRLKVFSSADMTVLGRLVVQFALPALIFRAVSTRTLAEIAVPGYLGAMLLGSVAVFWGGYLWSRRISGQTAGGSTFSAMGMSCANSGFVGYPVLLMALPEIATTALAMNMIVENLVMIPMGLAMAEASRSNGIEGTRLVRQIAARLSRNPIVLALCAGVVVSVFHIPLPQIIFRPVDILANASAAVSLIVIGGTLAGLSLSSLTLSVAPVVIGKLLIHPAAVALSLILMATLGFPVPEHLAAAAILMAAMPVMAIYPILAQRYGEDQTAALAMFLMTLLSFLTFSATLALVLP